MHSFAMEFEYDYLQQRPMHLFLSCFCAALNVSFETAIPLPWMLLIIVHAKSVLNRLQREVGIIQASHITKKLWFAH
jgi:hypothetical protein